jgi:hypothetical protein
VEFLACLRKAANKGLVAPENVPGNFRDLLQLFRLKFPTPEVLDRAFALYERYSLSHWDSFSSLPVRTLASPAYIAKICRMARITTA